MTVCAPAVEKVCVKAACEFEMASLMLVVPPSMHRRMPCIHVNLLYTIAEEHDTPNNLAQYREVLLSAQASHYGPECIALPHEPALLLYGLYTLNPSRVHLAVPKSPQLRRERPGWATIY